MDLENITFSEKSAHTKAHIVGPHFYEMSRTETEGRLMVARGWGGGERGSGGYGFRAYRHTPEVTPAYTGGVTHAGSRSAAYLRSQLPAQVAPPPPPPGTHITASSLPSPTARPPRSTPLGPHRLHTRASPFLTLAPPTRWDRGLTTEWEGAPTLAHAVLCRLTEAASAQRRWLGTSSPSGPRALRAWKQPA